MAMFPTFEWAETLRDKLNSDQQYSSIARNWEGDILFVIEQDGPLKETLIWYFDLWHGKCRKVEEVKDPHTYKPAFILKAPYQNFAKVIMGELHPMQAMMTRKLHVQGNMAVMLRNVPTVLDFVRCANEITDDIME